VTSNLSPSSVKPNNEPKKANNPTATDRNNAPRTILICLRVIIQYIIGAHAVGIGESDAYLELRLGRRTVIGLYPEYARTGVSDMRDEVSKLAPIRGRVVRFGCRMIPCAERGETASLRQTACLIASSLQNQMRCGTQGRSSASRLCRPPGECCCTSRLGLRPW
jgi:hypothetical protein